MPIDNEDALEEAYERALKLEKSGRRHEAIAAWQEVLALDPDDHGGASVRLAALGHGDQPARAPDAYVATLFDQHAEVFDAILVDDLGYAVPMMVEQVLRAVAPGPHAAVLDLGCGTGLAGVALADIAGSITGVDLSEGMLQLAEERDVYDALFVGEVTQFLAEDEDDWDLIVATDVLPYLGGLEDFFRELSARLLAGGWTAFSSETLDDAAFGARDWKVTPGHRFAHRESYLRQLLAVNGLVIRHIEQITVRMEEGEPIPGHLVVAQKPA
jgi:predicted TPR repeat methyltransferase